MSYGQQMPGGGAPTVDAILSAPHARPGGAVAGKVHLRGGSSAVDIRHVTIALMPRMDNGYGGQNAGPEIYRGALTRSFRLEAGAQRDLAFSIPLPYELPFTTVLGRELPGFTIGLCTEVDTVGVPDPGDVDPISVEPLESQQWVLAAIAQLGFKIRNVSFEQSKLRGVSQQLPFYQEIQLAPPQQYRDRVGEVGLSFVAAPGSMAFVLEADRRHGGGSADETFGRFKCSHKEAAETDWPAQIGKWLDKAAAQSRGPVRSPGYGGAPQHHGTPPHGAPLPPPPGPAPGAFPPPAPGAAPGAPGVPAPAAANYGVPPAQPGGRPGHPGQPGQPGQHGQPGQFPPPAPAPGQMPGQMPGQPPGHMPGHHAPPPGGHGPAPVPGQMPGPAPVPGPVAPPYAAPAGPPPPAHVHHGQPAHYPPGYRHGHHGHHPGWGAAAAVGGVAAAGVAAAGVGYAASQYPGQWVDQAAANVAGNVGGWAVDQGAQFAVDQGAQLAGDVAGEVAGEAAGIVGEVLGGLLGGLFG
ncbi:sporulation protein [Spirillospora sp. NPDC047279]|uniref:sporulation protein n=1 Tax=Spirillospora sp. NPDC047279 TaxID=3155478 RepID=UPI0033EB5B71